MKYINLISGPRNISTALMYSFAQRPDTIVFDEPFYAVYLNSVPVEHPGKAEVLASQPSKQEEVLRQIFQASGNDVVFIKNMAHHIEIMDKSFLKQVTNVFLIRNPLQIIASYSEVINTPVMRDIGIEFQFQLFQELRSDGSTPVVIDSGLVVENPPSVLSQLCEQIGIQFTEKMLSWPAGPKPYDGVWAPYWYDNVHRSTGFEKQYSNTRKLPETLVPLYEQAKAYYDKLCSFAIRP